MRAYESTACPGTTPPPRHGLSFEQQLLDVLDDIRENLETIACELANLREAQEAVLGSLGALVEPNDL